MYSDFRANSTLACLNVKAPGDTGSSRGAGGRDQRSRGAWPDGVGAWPAEAGVAAPPVARIRRRDRTRGSGPGGCLRHTQEVGATPDRKWLCGADDPRQETSRSKASDVRSLIRKHPSLPVHVDCGGSRWFWICGWTGSELIPGGLDPPVVPGVGPPRRGPGASPWRTPEGGGPEVLVRVQRSSSEAKLNEDPGPERVRTWSLGRHGPAPPGPPGAPLSRSLQVAQRIARGQVQAGPRSRDRTGVRRTVPDPSFLRRLLAPRGRPAGAAPQAGRVRRCFAHHDVQSVLFNLQDLRPDPPGTGTRTGRTRDVAVLELGPEDPDFPGDPTGIFIENLDRGAEFYPKFFYGREHQNYLGVDDNLGPVALSVQREILQGGPDRDRDQYQYRIILRTAQVRVLRGSVLEDSVPSRSRRGSSGGLPLKDVLDLAVPELSISCLRLATDAPLVQDLLVQLDLQQLVLQQQVRVFWTSQDQTLTPALEQFLDLLGLKVRPKTFSPVQRDRIGSISTTFRGCELTFLMSNHQKLRHLGNQTVILTFREAEAPPPAAEATPPDRQGVVISVSVHRPCGAHTCYSISTSRSQDVPPFGPPVPSGPMSPASPGFRDFLLAKLLNGGGALRRTEGFVAMVTRHRRQRLRELAAKFSSSSPADRAAGRLGLAALVGRRRREPAAWRPLAHLRSAVAAPAWPVTLQDFGPALACRLAVSARLLVLVDEDGGQVVFACRCNDLIGWSTGGGGGGVKIFYERGESLAFSVRGGGGAQDVEEICQRLLAVSGGAPVSAMTLRREGGSQLGFQVNMEGVVAGVEGGGAREAGLRPGCRLLEVCGVAVATAGHQRTVELLRTSATVGLVVAPPHADGTPRRSVSEMYHLPTMDFRVAPPPSQPPPPPAPPLSRFLSNQSARSEGGHWLVTMSSSRTPREPGPPPPDSSCTRCPGDRPSSSDPAPCRRPEVLEVRSSAEVGPPSCHRPAGRRAPAVVGGNQRPPVLSGGRSRSACSSSSSGEDAWAPVAAATLALRDVGGWRGDSSNTSSMSSSSVGGPVCGSPVCGSPVCGSPVCGSCVRGREEPQLWSRTSTSSSSSSSSSPTLPPAASRPIRDEGPKRCDVRQLWSPWRRPLTRSSSVGACGRPAPPQPGRGELSLSDSSLADVRRRGDAPPRPLPPFTWQRDAPCLHGDGPDAGAAPLDSGVPAGDLCVKVERLEENLRRLRLHLLQERRDKEQLRRQLLGLRHDNRRLQEESLSAAAVLRCFHLLQHEKT